MIIIFSSDSVKVKDCHKLSKVEQIEVVSFIVDYLKRNNIYYERTINNFLAELSLHEKLYKLGVEKERTIDSDLEFIEDSRWYVRVTTIIFQILGI